MNESSGGEEICLKPPRERYTLSVTRNFRLNLLGCPWFLIAGAKDMNVKYLIRGGGP